MFVSRDFSHRVAITSSNDRSFPSGTTIDVRQRRRFRIKLSGTLVIVRIYYATRLIEKRQDTDDIRVNNAVTLSMLRFDSGVWS